MSKYDNPYYMGIPEIIGLIMLTLVMIICLGSFALQIYNDETLKQVDTLKVDCYDRLNNKIIGEVCLEKVYCGDVDYFFKIKGCEVKK